jgi:hypothetical protein
VGEVHDFQWFKHDALPLLPSNWDSTIRQFAREHQVERLLTSTSVTSRELSKEVKIPVSTVGGREIRGGLPWLFKLYHGAFRELGQTHVAARLATASDDRYAINLNVQSGSNNRYECHVDSNPLQGLMYVTTHEPGSGGELVISLDPTAVGPEQIEKACIRIYPKSGMLIFFDGRLMPHFVTPLKDTADVRIAVAMNFYTPTCPEGARPKDLNTHLFGEG